jgi:hypothetical protein
MLGIDPMGVPQGVYSDARVKCDSPAFCSVWCRDPTQKMQRHRPFIDSGEVMEQSRI